MHASSLENMQRCYRRHIAGGPLETQAETMVLDVGGADVNGSYRDVFAGPPFRYRAADMQAGPGVEIVLDDPYHLPFSDGSIDIVLCGQVLEHCEYFWRAFAEMLRVLRPDGFIFIIAPSSGGIHRYPVDCYRFHPDAYTALATLTGASLVECWLDERGPWRDLVGVFRRADAPAHTPSLAPPAASPWQGAPGTPADEAIGGGMHYLTVLERLHRELSPAHYLEIGIRQGHSLALATGPATGVDPHPVIDRPLPATTTLYPFTSDEFFALGGAGVRPDLAFVDGMHLCEFALRDFMHIERAAAPGAVVVLDDVFPAHPAQAARDRHTQVWTGDIWRLAALLRQHRPDLFLLPLDTSPTGLLLVAGLDPANRVLWDGYNPLVRDMLALEGPPPEILSRHGTIDPASVTFDHILATLRQARAEAAPPGECVARLRRAATPKVSLVVIGYNMARELPRTIRSLSPAMQRGIDPHDYEVILVDNGSTEPFDAAELRRILPGLVIHHFPEPTASPVKAINFGIAQARGDLIGVCVDGARMASPGLLARALAASRLHQRPVIGTIAFHLGPGAQMDTVKAGYDQRAEDALLAGSGWEDDGYRLFNIAALAKSSEGGWFALPRESNAFFLRAAQWHALGGWDEGFTSPGGGLASHDTWCRACSDPHAEIIMLLGEATFHQVHGGIATNRADTPMADFVDEYVRLRGRGFEMPARRPLQFGTLPAATG